ncbi:hypothetical protein G9409_03970 [Chlorobium sp. BLA1]|uniref:hypothetical protein n=1 Tax=Candidatus Chlorobium masyuteum TaxID=2716876 RepID=UPI001420D423|nr:hypothetical protein [Candidatus Chlorobium masyuteum]NHQ59754.1 hypothetical protein [Candidatus Chlorobium masyuteum]
MQDLLPENITEGMNHLFFLLVQKKKAMRYNNRIHNYCFPEKNCQRKVKTKSMPVHQERSIWLLSSGHQGNSSHRRICIITSQNQYHQGA